MYMNKREIYNLIVKFIEEHMEDRITYEIVQDLEILIKNCIDEYVN